MHQAGKACAELRLYERAMDFLVTCKKILNTQESDQLQMTLDVTCDLADVCASLNEVVYAAKFYEEAIQTSLLLDKTEMVLKLEKLLNSVRNKFVLTSDISSDKGHNERDEDDIDELSELDQNKIGKQTEKSSGIVTLLQQINSCLLSSNFNQAIQYLNQTIHLLDNKLAISNTMRSIATLYHIKANKAESASTKKDCMAEAERRYKQLEKANSTHLSTKMFYAMLCFQQLRYEDALLLILPVTQPSNDQSTSKKLFTISWHEISVFPVSIF